MNGLQIVIGLTYALLALLLTPFYLRIIYIFFTKLKYRCLECYRIIIQIGIVQCLMAPGIFFVGVTHLNNADPFRFASTSMKLMTAGVRLEALMSLVLGLNRLKIICGLKYPEQIHTAMLAANWLFGVAYFVILLTPCCGYIVVPGEFLSKYDYSRPFTEILAEVGSLILLSATCMTALIYAIIILYLIWTKRKLVHVKNAHGEKKVLVYAAIRFAVDISLTLIYNFGHLPHKPAIDFPLFLGYILNNLALPPALYLCLHRELREVFFKCSRNKTTVVNTIDVHSRQQCFRKQLVRVAAAR